MMTATIDIQRVKESRLGMLDFTTVQFGKEFSDHMLVADCIDGVWQEPKIMPFGPLPSSPAQSALHYGQAIFEGMKAFRTTDNQIQLFRPLDNFHRMNISAERMAMPPIPESIFMEGLLQLVKLDAAWVPDLEGYSLYIRPVYYATEEALGVRPSSSYRFVILTSPAGKYYADPVKVLVETEYTRASEGGMGYAKAAGNYGGSLHPTMMAKAKGYDQLIWMDAKEHRFAEESGTMNVMFVIDGKLVTPALSTSKLAGITRDSILKLAKSFNIPVEERNISIEELISAHQQGHLQDAFGVGTAANLSPISLIGFEGKDYHLPPVAERAISNRLGDALNGIKYGTVADSFGWTFKIDN